MAKEKTLSSICPNEEPTRETLFQKAVLVIDLVLIVSMVFGYAISVIL